MVDGLAQYRQKRNFNNTGEPEGTPNKRKSPDGGLFVIHMHDARRLHYDLRLEHNGVLWSWAVTRGPSLDPSDKRLAVHVENHPLDYGEFEGVIPEGSYGAGSVIIWDNGTWLSDGNPAAGMKKGHLRFSLFGKKLKGAWDLVRLKPKEGEKRDNWLLIKVEDNFAQPNVDILGIAPKSVKSGLTVAEIGAGKKSKTIVTALTGSKKKKRHARLDFIAPALATLKSNPPSGNEWVHEVKFDGYRIQAHVSGGEVKLYTRSGLDWTGRFGEALSSHLSKLKCDTAIIDGEVVVLSAKGVASFSLLQADLSASRGDRMIYYAFDLLHLNGVSLMGEALEKRKLRLEKLLKTKSSDSVVRFSEDFTQTGDVMLAHACRMGLEGVISKRGNAPYRSGRTADWIKAKCIQRQEFIIIGYLPSAATGRGLRSLLVALRENKKLVYAGRVGTGFSAKVGDDLKKRLDRLKTSRPPVDKLLDADKDVIWVRPVLVGEVEFRAWTDTGVLRQASFKGLRDDKPAEDVIREVAMKEPAKHTRKPAKTRDSAVPLTHADKVLWPKPKLSKQDLLEYYRSVWSRMEPLVINRPLSLLRAPDGVEGQRFFQKHASPGMHPSIGTMRDPIDNQEHLYITNFDGVAALVQLGVIEIHIWGAKIDAIETPDQVVFDLDPDEGLDTAVVRSAALDVKKHLEDLGFESLIKTSGGKGFHVVIPLKPKARWEEVKTFARDFAYALAQSTPDKYTATLAKKARKGRIFIDYLRNGRGSTTVAAYSSRANPEAAVSMPIDWSQLKHGIDPNSFVINGDATRKALRGKDPWPEFFKMGKHLRA